MVQCIRCRHFDMKSHREHAAAGRVGYCPKTLQRGQFISAMVERDCKVFDEAPEDKELMEWAAKRPVWNEPKR